MPGMIDFQHLIVAFYRCSSLLGRIGPSSGNATGLTLQQGGVGSDLPYTGIDISNTALAALHLVERASSRKEKGGHILDRLFFYTLVELIGIEPTTS